MLTLRQRSEESGVIEVAPRSIKETLSLSDAALIGMTQGDLIGLRRDAKRLAGARSCELEMLRKLTARINEVLRSRAACLAIEVSDHAVLRYLERIEGVDISAVREKITRDAQSAMPLVGNRVLATDGYTICMAERHRVTTIYALDEEAEAQDSAPPADGGRRQR